MDGSLAGGLARIIVAILATAGYGGLLGLMALESACIPLPSEVVLPFAGFLVSQGKMNLFAVATIGALGCNLGSAVAYAVGRHGGRRADRDRCRAVCLEAVARTRREARTAALIACHLRRNALRFSAQRLL